MLRRLESLLRGSKPSIQEKANDHVLRYEQYRSDEESIYQEIKRKVEDVLSQAELTKGKSWGGALDRGEVKSLQISLTELEQLLRKTRFLDKENLDTFFSELSFLQTRIKNVDTPYLNTEDPAIKYGRLGNSHHFPLSTTDHGYRGTKSEIGEICKDMEIFSQKVLRAVSLQ